MPRDLFGDVTRPSISIGNRKRYSVPISLLSHSIILATFVVLPILAAPLMPGVMEGAMPDYINITVPPPPKPPAAKKLDEVKPVPNPNIAPRDVPTGITPEKPLDLDWQNTPTSGLDGIIAGGIDNGLPPPPITVVPPQQQTPIRVGDKIRPPSKTRNVQPVYPRVAQEARIEGTVIIEATISETGHIINAKLLRGVPLLDQAALEAVRQWEFTPSLLNGVPVPVIMTVTVTFTLSR